MTVSEASQAEALSVRVISVQCAIPSLTAEIGGNLADFGWTSAADAELTLLIDGPWGTALQRLLDHPAGNLVVLTDNPCPEYWEDL